MNTSDAVWLLQIDRPQRRNAMDSATANSLTYMLEQADTDPNCRCAILTGAGNWFCAGSDLKELAGCTAAEMALIETAKAELARAIASVDIPVIAAVSGYALGGGLSLAASCDYVVADADSVWQMPEVANGWLPPWGIEPVMKRCGDVAAKQILWGVTRLDGTQAHQLGLVDIICPSGQSLARAEQLAQSLSLLPPISSKAVKAYQRSTERQSASSADMFASQKFQEHCLTPSALVTLRKFGKDK